MSQPFAKLFERNGRQVVVTREPYGDNAKPSIVLAFEVSCGVCRTGLEFADSDKGEALRDQEFLELTEDIAFKAVDCVLQDLGELIP